MGRSAGIVIGLTLASGYACASEAGPHSPVEGTPPSTPRFEATSVEIRPAAVTIDSGGTTTLTAVVAHTGSGTQTTAVAWASSNSSVATVASSGLNTAEIVGLRGGEVTISASLGGKSASAIATVRPDRTLRTHRSFTLSASVEPFAGGPPNLEVLVIPAGGQGVTNVTFHPASDYGALWSPDGERLLFTSDRDIGNRWANGSLYVVTPSGGPAVRVASLGTLGRTAYSWAASGGINFVRYQTHDEGEGLYTVPRPGVAPVRIASADSLRPRSILEPVENFTFSRSGSRLAFVLEGRVYVASFSSTPMPRVVTAPCVFPSTCRVAPAWSPDERQLAVLRDGGLWIADVGFPQAVRVADADSRVTPSWSPDGTRVAYVHSFQLKVLDVSRSSSRVLATATEAWSDAFGEINWSTDGALIAVRTGRGVSVVRVSDDVERLLFPGSGFAYAWSP